MLMNANPDNPIAQGRIAKFREGLEQLGWTDGRNLCPRCRPGHYRRDPRAPLLQATRTIPIVFTIVADPVGAGYVDSLARPGGNATGFTVFDYSISAKWPELLKEIAPMKRAAVLRDPALTLTGGTAQFAAIQAIAPTIGVEVSPVSVRDADQIERHVTAFASTSNGGLIVMGSPLVLFHRDLIITVAARHKLPAVYYESGYVKTGGLLSYGPNFADQYRLAASYVDRRPQGRETGRPSGAGADQV